MNQLTGAQIGATSIGDGQNQPTCASTRLGTTWNGCVNRYAEPDASALRLIWVAAHPSLGTPHAN